MNTEIKGGLTELAQLIRKPQMDAVNNVPFITVPEGYRLETLERLLELDAPKRIRREARANDIRGFIDYVLRYKQPCTQIYAASLTAPKLLARIDDHLIETPSLNTHSAAFECPFTHEWNTWKGSSNKTMGQVEFAEFIESNLRDILKPNGGELLNAALNFRDHGSAKFQSAVRLSSGRVQFSYIEKDEADKIEFPEGLELGLPVFEGSTVRYTISAKLRYRIRRDDDKGELILWYELDRPDLVVRQAYDDLIDDVEKRTSIHVIRAL